MEPARNAADLARSRGVTILGQTLDDIPPDSGQFDAVLAIDVIEHVTEPVSFFRLIHDLLRPGGIFMAFTGDTDTWPWRWYKNRYWYCSLPEHVSFYSGVAMEYLARSVEMHTVSHTHLGHQRMSLKSCLRERAKNAFFMTGTTIGWCGVPSLRQKYGGGAGPILLNVSDHMLHLMRRR